MQRTWLHRYRNERRERWGRKKGFSVTSPATFQTLSASSAGFRHFALGELLLQSSHGMGQPPTARPPSRPLDAPAAARELPRWQRAVQSSCSIKWGLVAPRFDQWEAWAWGSVLSSLPLKDRSEKQPFIRLLGRYILQNQPYFLNASYPLFLPPCPVLFYPQLCPLRLHLLPIRYHQHLFPRLCFLENQAQIGRQARETCLTQCSYIHWPQKHD